MILSGLKYLAGRLSHSIAVVAAAAAMMMVSCSHDAPDSPTGEDQAGMVAFRLLTYKTAASPTVSRATWDDPYDNQLGNEFETALLKDQLYVVITDAGCAQEYAVTNLVCTKTTETPLTVTYEYTGRVDKDNLGDIAKLTNGKLHIVANAGYKPQLSGETTFSHYGQPDGSFTAIPMWGVKTFDFSAIGPDAPLNVGDVSLLRSMAKIVIENDPEADNYIKTLKSVTMSAVNTKGYLLPDGWTDIADTKTLDRHASRIPDQDTYPVTFDFVNNRVEFYVPEIQNSADNELTLNLTFDTYYDVNTPKDKTKFLLKEEWSTVNATLDAIFSWDAPNWESTTAIKSLSCPRFATALDGKIYTVDMQTMSIAEFTPGGKLVPLYKLPSLKGSSTKVGNNVYPDHYGTAISHDEAGNFLIGHYFTRPISTNVWTIYSPKSGEAKHFTLDLPAGYTSGRIDCVGHIKGDLTKDAVVHIAPTEGNKKVLTVKFAGSGTVSSVTASCTTTDVSDVGNSVALCHPIGPDLFAYYSKSTGRVGIYNVGATSTTANKYITLPNNANTEGFETFLLGGRRYYIVNYLSGSNTGNTRPMDIAVFDENGNLCATWQSSVYKSTLGYSSIIAEPVDENTVDIYVYNCTQSSAYNVAGAKLRLSLLHSDISGETTCERTGTIYFRPYADGDPVSSQKCYGVYRNYLYQYTVNMINSLSAKVEVVPYHEVILNPDFGFDDPLPRPPSEWVTPPWIEIGD